MIDRRGERKKCLIITDEKIDVEPRIRNLIMALNGAYEFSSLAPGRLENVEGFDYVNVPRKNWHLNLPYLVKRIISLYFKLFQWIEQIIPVFGFWKHSRAAVDFQPEMTFNHLELIVCVHPWNMPIALRYKKKFDCSIILDLYEYYPGQFPSVEFKSKVAPYYDYLIRRYANKSDLILFAAPGFRDKYKKVYGIDGVVFPCAAPYVEARESKKDEEPEIVRMVHHGIANRSRKIEQMIYCANKLPEKFLLDIFLVESPADPEYLSELKKITENFKNVCINPPIPFNKIVSTIAKYDVGVYLLPPESENQDLLLPNKIFEFIQARLCCVIGPSKGFSSIVSKYDIGVISSDFSQESFLKALLKVDKELISNKRKNLDLAARELALDRYFSDFLDAVEKVDTP